MLLTLIQPQKIATLALPERVSGRYTLGFVTVEGIQERWLLQSNRHIRLDMAGLPAQTVALENGGVYPLWEVQEKRKLLLFVDPETDDRRTYRKYVLPASFTLHIGREEMNEICYRLPYVSGRHAKLEGRDGRMFLTDLNSANGTFVNNLRVESREIFPGDVIYINGLRLLPGKGFLALNNPDGRVRCSPDLVPFEKPSVPPLAPEQEEEDAAEPSGVFYRSPRFKREVETARFTIDPPPPPPSREATPMMLVLGPSMTMGLVSLSTGFFTLYNVLNSGADLVSAMPSLVMSVGMLMGTVLWPVVTKGYEKKNHRRREEKRQSRYKAYIQQVRSRIEEESARQRAILEENIVTLEDCMDRIRSTRRNLWERTYRHNDFLMLRLGTGTRELDAAFRFPEEKFALEEDPLQKELYDLCNGPHEIFSVPLALSLRDTPIVGVIGQREEAYAYVRGLILQIGALHSYDEVKMVFLYDRQEGEEWDFAKWLPHTWDEEGAVHYMAAGDGDARELSVLLEREFAQRSGEDNRREPLPWYVVFALDRRLGERTELVRQILSQKECRGFSLVVLCEELRLLPKECAKVVELHGQEAWLYDQDDIYGRRSRFTPDISMTGPCRELAVKLGNTFLQTAASKKELPEMLTFLQLFGVGKTEHLNALTRWKEHDPTRTLATEVGVDENGARFTLDLHEKFHGPHGLVAGMTGSGKSEFIMTYILSLAVNYHPNEVAFILIDYKGGGMAQAFETLPHTVGIITNLDGAAVSRSLVSIQSELKRRQTIFQQVSKQINVSNIDIYKYQKLYREGTVTEPLQHLFIISDEFAELKTQQPDFMNELVSAARIGRSLGVHLILATQKPSGVVDDQIWSNSRFRVCLKVQEKSDSMDMLKRPDAASLTKTGRFYLQVGYNEVFEMGQSAWSGAPYLPSDRPETGKDRSVSILDGVGHVVRGAALKRKRGSGEKQLDTIVRYLAALAQSEGIRPRPMWMPPLKTCILLQDLTARYATGPMEGLNPVVGEADDPQRQRQFPMTLPLSREGNAVIYGAAGGGKTTFITTMLYGLLKEHSARTLRIYLLDFGAETLRAFAKAPQVGDVLFSGDEEKMENFFKMLGEELQRRKGLCAEYAGDMASYNRFSGDTLPYLLTVIQNYAGFCEDYEELEAQVALLSREGTKYGILFVITAVNSNAVRYRTLQNFRQLLVLQMNDTAEYSGILGSTGGVIPGRCKGRGLVKTDRVYEFQTACLCEQDTPAAVRAFCETLSACWTGPRAPRVPILPERVTPSFVENEIDAEALCYPVGIEKESLHPATLSLRSRPIHYVLSREGSPDFLKALAQVVTRKEGLKVIVLDASADLEGGGPWQTYRGEEALNGAVVELFGELVRRHNTAKDILDQGGKPPVYPPVLYLVNGANDLFAKLSDDGKDKLHVLLDKCTVSLGVFFLLAEPASGVSAFSFRPWFKKQPVFQNALWVGDGISDQFHLKVRSSARQLYESIGEEFGYLVEDGRPVLLKLLTPEEGGMEHGAGQL